MKPDIHPEYRPVVFLDTSSGEKTLTRSTIATTETVEWEDGNTYPLAKVEISSASHPFFTGQMTIVDTAGRVERFERRYGKRKRSTAGAASEAETDAADTDAEAVEADAADVDAADAEAKTDATAEAAAPSAADAPTAADADVEAKTEAPADAEAPADTATPTDTAEAEPATEEATDAPAEEAAQPEDS